jgi:hypothetical protein
VLVVEGASVGVLGERDGDLITFVFATKGQEYFV